MKFIMMSVLSLSVLSSPVSGNKVKTVEVPRGTGIEIAGLPNFSRGPRLVLSVPVRPDGSVVRPDTLRSMAQVLRSSLPKEFMDDYLYSLGFVIGNSSSRRSDDFKYRLADLYRFLYDLYNLEDEKTALGRSADCISSGEYDLTALMYVAARMELMEGDNYERRADVPKEFPVWTSFKIAEQLVDVCSTQVGQGPLPPK